MTATGLRERKKERTRRALFAAALQLFDERGYDETTIAQIAAAADVSTRTFFSYYPSKEDVVFYDSEQRVGRALAVIAEGGAGERPVEVLVRAVRELVGIIGEDTEYLDPIRVSAARMQLVLTVPALQAYVLRLMHEAQRRLSEALRAAYPGELAALDARIMVSVLVSAMQSAALLAVESDQPADAVSPMRERAIELTMRGLGSMGPARS